MPITTFNVEEVFTWVAPEDPHDRLVKKISDDFIVLAQSILYNVPDSAERVAALKKLYEVGAECARLIRG